MLELGRQGEQKIGSWRLIFSDCTVPFHAPLPRRGCNEDGNDTRIKSSAVSFLVVWIPPNTKVLLETSKDRLRRATKYENKNINDQVSNEHRLLF